MISQFSYQKINFNNKEIKKFIIFKDKQYKNLIIR